jgi:ATP-dependent helicase YprA (DUF1998 family)
MPYPAKHVAIRGVEEERYTLIDKFDRGGAARIIEEVEISRALFEVYEGAVVCIYWINRAFIADAFLSLFTRGSPSS